MKLLLKFNLVFVLIFAIGLAATGFVSWTLLERNARDEIAQNARLLMDTALAARAYTSSQVNPLLETQMKYTFLPQSVPAYSATEVFNDLRKKHTEYGYKEAVLNPTNPRNRAVDWEADLITQFRSNKEAIELGWTLNDVVGAQIISVPTKVPLDRAKQAFTVFMASVGGVLIIIGIVLNLMLWAMVIRPIGKLSNFADRVSLGELEIPEFQRKSSDEIGMLSRSIARMRTSMVQAMKMLDS